MPRSLLLVLAGAAVGAAAVALAAQDRPSDAGRPSDEFRDRFIREFDRSPLNTTPEDALLLRILVQARGAKRGIEVGSADGFGAINMGVGFERTGGHLWTLDIDPRMVRACRQNVRKMGLTETVTVVEGDALKALPAMEGEYDFVFLDAVKRDYFRYFKALEGKLRPGAVVVADNAVRSARAMEDFLDFMRDSPDWEMVVVRASDEKGDGMAVCYRVK